MTFDLTKIDGLVNEKCKYVACGGSAGSYISLHFGPLVPRSRPLNNDAHPEWFRHNHTTLLLYVCCEWRLEDEFDSVTSSDDESEIIIAGLTRLHGEEVLSFMVDAPVWDLQITFSSGLKLLVFCNRLRGSDQHFNWRFRDGSEYITAGPGSKLASEPRSGRK